MPDITSRHHCLHAQQVATAATYTAGGGGPDGRGGSDASHREPMDGNEIWELNKRLGQLAERLADPADLEPQPKRKKSLTLQEKCHNAWGVVSSLTLWGCMEIRASQWLRRFRKA